MTEYICKKHPDRLAVEPIAHRRCQQCREDALDFYVNQKAPAYPWRPSMDTDVGGAPLYGHGSREAGHKRHQTEQKESDE